MKMNMNQMMSAVGVMVVVFAMGFYAKSMSPLGAASGQTVSAGTVSVIAVPGTDSSPAIAQVNTDPVLLLVDHLQAYGAKIGMVEFEKNGLNLLQISIDGKNIPPIVVGCKQCEPIVFEY